jgi:hypothetical protein
MLRCNGEPGAASRKGDIQVQTKDSGVPVRNVRILPRVVFE